MMREETTREPRPQHREPKDRGDTLTPTTRDHPTPVQGTSREDMRRDTQRPARAGAGAVNVFRFSA